MKESCVYLLPCRSLDDFDVLLIAIVFYIYYVNVTVILVIGVGSVLYLTIT